MEQVVHFTLGLRSCVWCLRQADAASRAAVQDITSKAACLQLLLAEVSAAAWQAALSMLPWLARLRVSLELGTKQVQR